MTQEELKTWVMKLSQTTVLSDGNWHSSYEIQMSRNILNSLVRKGILIKRSRLGSMFSPRTNIDYKLKYRVKKV